MLVSIAATVLVSGVAQSTMAEPGDRVTDVRVEGDADIFGLIFAEHTPQVVATGFNWTEGPVWAPPALYFSDTIKNVITRFEPQDNPARGGVGLLSTALSRNPGGAASDDLDSGRFLEPGPNGLALTPDGKGLIVCRHGGRSVGMIRDTASMQQSGSRVEIETLAAEFSVPADDGGQARVFQLNSPNDVAVSPAGDMLYFTDPPYGFLNPEGSNHPGLLAHSAYGESWVFRLDLPISGTSSAPSSGAHPIPVRKGITRPNGIGLSPDGSRLYISDCRQAESQPGEAAWFEHRIGVQGDLEPTRTVEIKFDSRDRGCADGFAVIPDPRYSQRDGEEQPPMLLVGSCPGGLCVVDMRMGRSDSGSIVQEGAGEMDDRAPLLARLRTNFKISNVAFSPDFAYFTGEGGVWRLPLASSSSQSLERSKDEL